MGLFFLFRRRGEVKDQFTNIEVPQSKSQASESSPISKRRVRKIRVDEIDLHKKMSSRQRSYCAQSSVLESPREVAEDKPTRFCRNKVHPGLLELDRSRSSNMTAFEMTNTLVPVEMDQTF